MVFEYLQSNWLEVLFICSSMIMLGIALASLYYDKNIARDWQRRFRGLRGTTDPLLSTPPHQLHGGWYQGLNLLGKWLRPRRANEISRTQSLLTQAGYRSQDDINSYYGLKFGLMILLPAIIYVAISPSMADLPKQYRLLMPASLLFSALVGTLFPELLLKARIKKRRNEIWRSFSDALDLIALCVESGLSLDAALHRVANDIRLTHPILGRELRIVSDSIRTGQARVEALRQLSIRTDMEDIQSFTNLVSQTEKLGVNITQGMKKIAESIRTKRRNQAEKLANELPVKLLFPLILFFLPAIGVILLLPALLSIIQNFNI